MSGDGDIRRSPDDHTFLEAGKGREVPKKEPVQDMEGIIDICNVLSAKISKALV